MERQEETRGLRKRRKKEKGGRERERGKTDYEKEWKLCMLSCLEMQFGLSE